MLDKAIDDIDCGRWEAAAAVYGQVAELAPADPDVHHTLGLVHLERNDLQRALFHIGRSLELNPGNAAAFRSMGDALARSGQSPLAIRAYEKSIGLDPQNPDPLLNMGNLFHEMGQFDRSKRSYQRILDRAPQHHRALNNLAKLYHDWGKLELALSFYDRCIQDNPDYAEARFNRSVLLLTMGEFKSGWQEYEWRFRRSNWANIYPHRLRSPRWQGQAYQGQKLLVHCEQGMGDVLQFFRYLPLVKQLGGTLILEVHEPLVPLLGPQPCIDEIVTFDLNQPPTVRHDMHTPLLRLPEIFKTRLDSIPTSIPYIEPAGRRAMPVKQYVKKGRINIGLVWASSALNPRRNLPIDQCRRWFQNPDYHFVSLQMGGASGQISRLRGISSTITHLGHTLKNFNDTAQIVASLDLVITVDTATAHLAGAMGTPLWVLLPFNADWRWGSHGDSCPWYPGARLFRQSVMNQWDTVVDAVGASLLQLNGKPNECVSISDPRAHLSCPAKPHSRLSRARHFRDIAVGEPSGLLPQISTRDFGAAAVHGRAAGAGTMIYLGLVKGDNYGWGVCSRYLIHELSRLRSVRVLTGQQGPEPNGRLGAKLFQALTGADFRPLFETARGTENFGYTFFENELGRHSIENAKRYDLVLAGSSWCRDRMQERGISNCDVLIQGIDPDVFHPIKEHTPPDRFVIFSGGKFELRKGQDLVLRAVKVLQEKYPDVYLVNCWYNLWPQSARQMACSPHISFQYNSNHSWTGLMQQTYLANGLDPGRIRTMGLVPYRQQRELFKQTDIGIFPNRCEGGTNLVMMEYMACAKPAIVSYTSGHKDIVTEDNALLLRQMTDLEITSKRGALVGRWQEPCLDELISKLEFAYHHRSRLRKIGHRAGSDLSHYTWKRCARQLNGFIGH